MSKYFRSSTENEYNIQRNAFIKEKNSLYISCLCFYLFTERVYSYCYGVITELVHMPYLNNSKTIRTTIMEMPITVTVVMIITRELYDDNNDCGGGDIGGNANDDDDDDDNDDAIRK